MAEKKTLAFVGILTLILATSPMFFDIYRMAAFNTIPRDDYAPYLLALVGEGDGVPGAPSAYRIISVAVAIPFYYILPVYVFTNLSTAETPYLRATQALSFSSYMSLVLTAATIYAISRKQFSATRASSLIVGLLSLFLSSFVSRVGIDPFAILVTSLLLLWVRDPVVFAPLILVSVGINEKIPIIFSTILAFRFASCIKQRRRFAPYVQLWCSLLAVLGYLAVRLLVKIPGHEAQTNPALFLQNLQSSLVHSLSPKGLFLNALPLLVLSLVVVFAVISRHRSSFHVSDVSGLFVLTILALIADVEYTVGRVVMYSYPLYLPSVGCFIDEVLELEGAAHGTS